MGNCGWTAQIINGNYFFQPAVNYFSMGNFQGKLFPFEYSNGPVEELVGELKLESSDAKNPNRGFFLFFFYLFVFKFCYGTVAKQPTGEKSPRVRTRVSILSVQRIICPLNF